MLALDLALIRKNLFEQTVAFGRDIVLGASRAKLLAGRAR
jgi:hypothetical protein